ncbi:MAG: hypothetical protein J3K34DRAFT_441921 [Monoraphidium minutum]|nr:MAG: hypothetical protein J3K34DRAFT_441921 [Monoraphidium minutum]
MCLDWKGRREGRALPIAHLSLVHNIARTAHGAGDMPPHCWPFRAQATRPSRASRARGARRPQGPRPRVPRPPDCLRATSLGFLCAHPAARHSIGPVCLCGSMELPRHINAPAPHAFSQHPWSARPVTNAHRSLPPPGAPRTDQAARYGGPLARADGPGAASHCSPALHSRAHSLKPSPTSTFRAPPRRPARPARPRPAGAACACARPAL